MSTETLRERLQEIGLHGRKPRKVPCLSPEHRHGRPSWCRYAIALSRRYWSRVIYSDESTFKLFSYGGRVWCWHRSGQAFDSRYTEKTLPHSAPYVSVWGCITSTSVGPLCRIECTLDAPKYIDILEDGLLGTLHDPNLHAPEVVFQHDNDPKHTSQLATSCLRTENSLLVLPWPSRSPDLSIIENFWAHLGYRLRRRSPLPRNPNELCDALLPEWY